MEEKKRELTRKEKLELEAQQNQAKEREAVTRASESSSRFNEEAEKKREDVHEQHSSFSVWGTVIMLGVFALLIILYFVFKENLSSIQMFEPTEGLKS